MRRTLSAKSTFAVKYVWPPLNAIIFVVIAVLLWNSAFKDSTGIVRIAKWFLPAIGIGTTVFAIFDGRSFKRVQVDAQALYVSNYVSEVRVDFSQIENVSVQWQSRRHRRGRPIVKIDLRNPKILGGQIEFIAIQPWNFSHSVVAELREWRDRASG